MYILVFLFLVILIIMPLLGRFLGFHLFSQFFFFFFISSLALSLLIFFEVVIMDYTCEVILFNWINLFSINVSFGFLYDKLSTTMLFLILFISFLVHLYALNYMQSDPSKFRFFFFLLLFTFFMCFMVISNNLIQFFFAWEGVGLTSYLLINFWYTRIEANRSAMKAILINRIGDFGLYFAILLIFSFFKTLDFTTLNTIVNDQTFSIFFLDKNFSIKELIALMFFLAVIGKSAQLGLHTWLPDAMEGPTPVSALLHAATMVTAGVFLLLRISYFLEGMNTVLIIISFWGALTALFASTIGAFQNDIKKIIAYSTCSQLGYMISACGMNNFAGAYFHLFNHAFFKALLFLGAGSIIHALSDEQDLRKYGRLINFLPLTYFCMFLASLSLTGIPFLSGFYSKDIIINWAFSDFEFYSTKVYWLLIFAAFFTSYYSTKLIFLTFFSKESRFSLYLVKNLKESDIRFKLPFILLALFSLFSGYLFFDLFVGYGNEMFFLSVKVNNNFLELEHLNQLRKFTPIFFVITGFLTYIFSQNYFYKNFSLLIKQRQNYKFFILIKNFLNKKWFFDYFYYYLTLLTTNFGYHILFKSFDRGIIEDIFIKKLIFFVINLGNYLNFYKNSNINSNIFNFLKILFVMIIISFFYLNLIYVSFIIFFFSLQFKKKRWE